MDRRTINSERVSEELLLQSWKSQTY